MRDLAADFVFPATLSLGTIDHTGGNISSLNSFVKFIDYLPTLKANEPGILANLLTMLQSGDHKGMSRYVNELIDSLLDAKEARLQREGPSGQ